MNTPQQEYATSLGSKTFLSLLIAGLGLSILAGCTDSEARRQIAALRAELVEHRFEGARPKIEIVILNKELVPSSGEYGQPKLRLTGVVRQVGDFPLAEYKIQATFSAKISAKKTATMRIHADIKDKTGAFTEDESIYDLKDNDLPSADAVVVTLTDFIWWMPYRWQDTVTLKTG